MNDYNNNGGNPEQNKADDFRRGRCSELEEGARDNIYTPVYRDASCQDSVQRAEVRRESPYSFDPEKGWPKTGDMPNAGYEWNFQDYDALAAKKKGGSGRNRGVIVFTVCLISVLTVGLFGVTAYSILHGMSYTEQDTAQSPDMFAARSSMGENAERFGLSSEAGSDVSLELTSKPQINETIPVGDKLAIPEIAKLVSPAVVGVSAHQTTRFYEPISVGSGIVMTEDGYIITNAHVVTGGAFFKVQLQSNLSYDAVLIGADPMTDLAVLKIDQNGLTAAIFGDSDELEVGETVIAIGNPSGMDLAGSVTQGIVSALNRIVSTSSYTFKYIQTDAAINPGNSGGALVNEYGQVIGINSSKIIASGYEGIGFAIPITDAKPILDDIIANGRVTGRAMLGITCVPVSDLDARDLGVPLGLEIIEILPASDMVGKDIQRGDIITSIDGKPVYSNSDVQTVLRERKAGDTVVLSLYRRITPVQEIEFDIEVRLIES